jgi:hypothetical protein
VRVLSVDLGTSNTVAVLSAHGRPPRVVEVDGSATMPSAVFAADDGSLVVGRDAERRARLDPARFEPNPKRRVDDGTLLLGDKVVPVPEPVAAAAHFASFPDSSLAPGQALVVYDLGAGTFDCAVVGATQNGFAVLAEDGLPDLGGLDVDQALAEHVGREVSHRDPSRWQRLLRPESTADRRAQRALREDVKAAKEALSRHPQTEVPMPEPFDDVLVTRSELQALVRPNLLRSVELLAATIRSTGMTPQFLAGIYLVGGSSRIPLVATLIAERLRVVPTSLDQPETAVALGAHHVPREGISLRTQDLSRQPSTTGQHVVGFRALTTTPPATPAFPVSGPTQPVVVPVPAPSRPPGYPAPAPASQHPLSSPHLSPSYGGHAPGGHVLSAPAMGGLAMGGGGQRAATGARNKVLLIGAAAVVTVLAVVGGVYAFGAGGMPSAADCARPGSTDDKGFTPCLRQLAGTIADKNTCKRGFAGVNKDVADLSGVAVSCQVGSGSDTYSLVYTHASSAQAAQAEADAQLERVHGNRVEADWKGNGLQGHYRAAVDQASSVLVFTVKDRPLVGTLLRLGGRASTVTPNNMADYFERNIQPGT